MKTLLIYPPCYPLFGDAKDDRMTNIPPGLPYLSAYLKRAGQEVSIIDLNIKMHFDAKEKDKELWNKKNCYLWENRNLLLSEVLPRLQDIQEKWVDIILRSKSKIVGFYVSNASQWMAFSLAKKLKDRNSEIVIIFGGPGCFREKAEEFFKIGYVDAVVMGEGEATLLELVGSYEKSSRITPCPGAFFMKDGETIYGGPREPIKDLDALPYPDFSDLIDDYKTLFGDRVWLSISWLRGCTHKCAFCCDSRLWGPPRPRSPDSICQEFIFQKQKYNVKAFSKADLILAFSEELLLKTCDLLIEKDVDAVWGSLARTEKYMTLEVLKKMYRAGCKWLSYGIESGSQSAADRMNKGFQIKTAQDIIINTRKAGIKPSVNIMVGAPGETIIDFMKTVWFLIKNRKFIWDLGVSVATVVPMSDWYVNPEKYGILLDKDPKKKPYYLFWKTKYFTDNYRVREIKSRVIQTVYRMIS